MFIIAQLVAAAVIAGAPTSPAPTAVPSAREGCVTPDHTGTFRVTASTLDGKQGVPALLLLENIEGCLEATFIADGSNPAAIDHLSTTGDALQGRLNVTGTETKVTLRFDGSTIAGSIVGKKQNWKIEGRKTS